MEPPQQAKGPPRSQVDTWRGLGRPQPTGRKHGLMQASLQKGRSVAVGRSWKRLNNL